MTDKGKGMDCPCLKIGSNPDAIKSLTLLSKIPNQRVYRCNACHAFLSYSEDSETWELIHQPDVEAELKTLYLDASA